LRELTGTEDITIRIGLHTGSVIAGVVGLKDPRYHLFGENVNLAEKMESNGVPDEVHISESTYLSLKETTNSETGQKFLDEFSLFPRGTIPIKNFGDHTTFLIRPKVRISVTAHFLNAPARVPDISPLCAPFFLSGQSVPG
jgi:class 3 adenylate cyclase